MVARFAPSLTRRVTVEGFGDPFPAPTEKPKLNSHNASPDFRPSASWPVLRLRAALLTRVREFFDSRAFLEVETPILSADVVVDRHLDPMSTVLAPDPRIPDRGRRLYLQTSPEFAMKRLLAAGGEAIYQVTRAFRNGEAGRLHNPEFTIVEWYRAGDGMHAGIQLLSELAAALLNCPAAELLSYRDAFVRHAGIDPHTCTAADLASVAQHRAISLPPWLSAEDRDTWLDLLLVELVEPHLGQDRPTILFDYLASQAALARVRPDNPPVAERFELYMQGIELANGYHELLSADVLRCRNAENNARRTADGKPPLPEHSRLLAAMEAGLPDCTGAALGFDRVVMLAAGVDSIDEVLAFPIGRA
ncbi:MAG: EF-P lysine aminoacylase GenX [Planctomycetes bacterium]|nr:EF-P lysine aminoacylase GenX [Planctomycetota bacterium]